MQQLLTHFQQYLPLKGEEQEMISARCVLRKVKRRQMILQEGYTCKHYTFVLKGCFRMYAMDDKGTEHNVQFVTENDWIADIGSFHSTKPSGFFIEAIEPADIIQIEQQDLYFLYTNIPKLDCIFKVIVENKYIELQNRVLKTSAPLPNSATLIFWSNTHALPTDCRTHKSLPIWESHRSF